MTAPDPIPDFLQAVTTATPDPIPDLLKAVNEASGKAFALWITFLTVGIYLAIAIGTTTHLQLLLAGPVKLPLLGVDMPLFAFYGVAPPMFVVLHLYVLMQLYILARLLRLFDDQLRRAKMLELDRRMTRGQLDKFVFTQFLIGAPQDAIVRLFRTVPGPISPRRANCGVYGIHRNGRVLSRGMRHDYACCIMHWISAERSLAKEHGLPAKLQKPPGQRKRHVVASIHLPHRRQREQIRLDRQRIRIADIGEARIREHRKVVGAIWPHALAQRAQKLRIGPVPDSSVRIRRDVRAIKSAEWRGQCPPACERRSAHCGVARYTASRMYQVFAFRHRILCRRLPHASEPC